jgi:hypothetical protein
MNSQEKIDLKRLMLNMKDDYKDNTQELREMKHSSLLHKDILKMEQLKKDQKEMRENRPEEFSELCQHECFFLFQKYTDIYNRVLKDELDLTIMQHVLFTLKRIEDGEMNQEEGSVMVGKLLHELYVDSALKRSNHLDETYSSTDVPKIEGKDISWKEYKKKIH